MSQRFELMPMHELLSQRANYSFAHLVGLWAVRRYEFLFQPLAALQRRVAAAGEDHAIVEPQAVGTRPSVSKRGINACSIAIPAVLTLPERHRCKLRSSRVLRSMTKARTAQPLRPVHAGTDQSTTAGSGPLPPMTRLRSAAGKPTAASLPANSSTGRSAAPCSC